MAFYCRSFGKTLTLTISVIVLIVVLLASTSFVVSQPVVANANTRPYFSQLSGSALKFYQVLEEAETASNLKSGKAKIDLLAEDVVKQEQLQAYREGDKSLEKDFEIAKTAFSLDKNIYYVDFDKLCLSVGVKDNNFVATLGTGRNEDYYHAGITSAQDISSLENQYKLMLNSWVGSISNSTDSEKVLAINRKIFEEISFSYGDEVVQNSATKLVDTAWGALINKKANYEGIARLNKDLMDKLDIENVLVAGFVLTENEVYEKAYWNQVKIGDEWFVLNSGLNVKNQDEGAYCLVGQDKIRKIYKVSEKFKNESEIFAVSSVSEIGFFPSAQAIDVGLNTIEARRVTPSVGSILDSDKSYTFAIEYNEILKKANGTSQVNVKVSTLNGATGFIVTRIFWDNNSTITFDFTPSNKFNDNFETYTFEILNLIGNDSGLSPRAVQFSFQKSGVNVSTFSEDFALTSGLVLAENNNFNKENFTYYDMAGGTKVCNGNLDDRVVLASSRVLNSTKQAIFAEIVANKSQFSNVELKNVVSYQVVLGVNGEKVKSVKDQKIMLSLASKEQDYEVYLCEISETGALNLGSIKKLSSFKKGEEVLIETDKFGVILCIPVNKINSIRDNRVILLNNVTGVGKVSGKIEENLVNNIVTLVLDQRMSLEFKYMSGYSLDFCMLNGRDIEIFDNKATISFNDLRAENVLDFAFVADSVKLLESANGEVNLVKEIIQNQYTQPGLSTALLVCLICLGVVVLGLVIAYIVIRLLERKKDKKIMEAK